MAMPAIAVSTALATHIMRHSENIATSAADTAIPMPTPAKCTADKPPLPDKARRSSTSAELNTRMKALTMPAINRRTRKTGINVVKPIAARQNVFTASEPRSQARREPGRRTAASSAPAR